MIKMDGFFHPSQAKGAVHIIGCGAVGSSIAFILAHCGVTNFVLYDDDRLKSVLKWLAASCKGQILIFTCHQREMQMLNQCQVPYHLVDMEKTLI